MTLPPELIICIYNTFDDFRDIVKSLQLFPYLETIAYKKFKKQTIDIPEKYMLACFLLGKEELIIIKWVSKNINTPYYYNYLIEEHTDLDTIVYLFNYFTTYIHNDHFKKYDKQGNSLFTKLLVTRRLDEYIIKFLAKQFK